MYMYVLLYIKCKFVDILFENKLRRGLNSNINGGTKSTPYPLIDLEANKNQHDFSDLIQ